MQWSPILIGSILVAKEIAQFCIRIDIVSFNPINTYRMVTWPPQHQEDWNNINLLFFLLLPTKPPNQPHSRALTAIIARASPHSFHFGFEENVIGGVEGGTLVLYFYILYLCILRQFWKCNGWWIRWQSNAMEVNSGLTSTSSNKFGARVTTPDLWLFYWDHMKLGSKKGQMPLLNPQNLLSLKHTF